MPCSLPRSIASSLAERRELTEPKIGVHHHLAAVVLGDLDLRVGVDAPFLDARHVGGYSDHAVRVDPRTSASTRCSAILRVSSAGTSSFSKMPATGTTSSFGRTV